VEFQQKQIPYSIFALAAFFVIAAGCIHSVKPGGTSKPPSAKTSIISSNRTAEERKSRNDSGKIYGVTLDNLENIEAVTESLRKMKYKPTVRIVFDEKVPAINYLQPLKKIKEVAYIMGELADSYYMKNYSVTEYRNMTRDYLDTLGSVVDIWEFGNEVNGEWLGKTEDVVTKITNAFDEIEKRRLVSALTLYYNEDCWEKKDAEMFSWVKRNISSHIRKNVDYVLISYYEDDCNGHQPDWKKVFAQLAALFPGSKMGFGEVGSKFDDKKQDYIKKYYSMQINQPRFIGGYFWWYFSQDMVPDSKPLWQTLNSSFIE
jgi:hypothetical protein